MGGGDRRRVEGNRRGPSEQRGHECSLPRSLRGVAIGLHPGSVAGSRRNGIQPSSFLHALLKTRVPDLTNLVLCATRSIFLFAKLRIKPSVSRVLKKHSTD